MAVENRGRVAPSPPPPFLKSAGEPFTGAFPWNKPKAAIGRDRPLTRAEFRQVQAVLFKIDRLPFFLSSHFTSRYNYIHRTKSPVHGLFYLKKTFEERLWPRLERVNQVYGMDTSKSIRLLSERDEFETLPGMNDTVLKKFAAPRSPVNNCGIVYQEIPPDQTSRASNLYLEAPNYMLNYDIDRCHKNLEASQSYSQKISDTQ